MNEGDFVLLKFPPIVIAGKLRKGPGFIGNENYLNADIFKKQFYPTAVEILGPCLNGLIFEPEDHPKNGRFLPAQWTQDLDEFFSRIPKDARSHIELGTEAYGADPVFEVLKKHGEGLVFSHWTCLLPLRRLCILPNHFAASDILAARRHPPKRGGAAFASPFSGRSSRHRSKGYVRSPYPMRQRRDR
jgi:hypothetical protein